MQGQANNDHDNTIDLHEPSLMNTMFINFPNPDNILNFTLTIEPDKGMWAFR